MRVVIAILAVAPWWVGTAGAGSSWDAPAVNVEARGIHDSDLFPGSPLSTSDRGADLTGGIDTGRRLSNQVKLGLGAEAGGQTWSRFAEAGYGWLGAHATLRWGATQIRGDFEWTPHRLKFPAALDGGTFERREVRLGIRQALPGRLRLRAEARRQNDDFVTAYDVRDGNTDEFYGQISFRARDAVTLRVDALEGRTSTGSRKYAHDDRLVGGSAAIDLGRWRLDGGVWSGTSRYRKALLGDSNFRRRDQILLVRGEARRGLGHGLAALVGGEWTDQSSSRLDRAFSDNRIHVGLAWTLEGE